MRPEFLFSLDTTFPLKNLSEQWTKKNDSYMIKFKTNFYNYTDYTIDISETDGTHRNIILKMLDLALSVIAFGSEYTEVYSYLKEDTIIHKRDIIEIKKL